MMESTQEPRRSFTNNLTMNEVHRAGEGIIWLKTTKGEEGGKEKGQK